MTSEEVGDERVARFVRAATRLTDLVITDDMEYLDTLPEVVESNLATPIARLLTLLEEGHNLADIRSAAQMVEEIAEECGDAMPRDLADLIRDMRSARLSLP